MNDNEYFPDWFVGEPEKKNGLRNISNIRKITDKNKVINS